MMESNIKQIKFKTLNIYIRKQVQVDKHRILHFEEDHKIYIRIPWAPQNLVNSKNHRIQCVLSHCNAVVKMKYTEYALNIYTCEE